MPSPNPPPTLSVAQIMADLDSLKNADNSAATALLSASKRLSANQVRRRSQASILPEPPKFDSLGKRIVPKASMPAMSRINSESDGRRSGRNSGSSGSGSSANGNKQLSGVGTPYEEDKDMRRARELVELFEKKESFERMGTTGLGKSKRKVDEVKQRYAQKHLEERQRVAQVRQLGAR